VRGHRQLRFAQERARDRQRVDRVRLAPGARDPALLGHHLRRDPHHRLPGAEQVSLQPRGQVPAVLDRPGQLLAELLPGPPQRLQMPGRGGRDRQLPDLLADRVDSDERVRPLVYVSANNNHGGCLLHLISDWTVGPVGGHISVGAMPRSYQVTPAGPSHRSPAKRMNANPGAAPRL